MQQDFPLDSVVSYRVYAGFMDGLTRSQLAQRAEVNLETIRFYEREGLLPPAPRTASGYRIFSESAIDRLAFVKRAKSLGFSLEEIRGLLILQDEHADVCAEVRDLLQAKLSVVREKKAELEKLESHLSAALLKCNQALKPQPKHPEVCPVLRQMAERQIQKEGLKGVKIEVLYFGDCPNHLPTLERIHQVLREENCTAEVSEVLVSDVEAAHKVRFLGSPTVRVNGIDIEPGAKDRRDFGLMCRRYTNGMPSHELIREAVRLGSVIGETAQ